MHFFGGDQRKALAQVKAHLVTKNAGGAGAGAVLFVHALGVGVAQQVFVLVADGALGMAGHGCCWCEKCRLSACLAICQIVGG